MVKTHRKVLLVEDDLDHTEFVRESLRNAGVPDFEVAEVTNRYLDRPQSANHRVPYVTLLVAEIVGPREADRSPTELPAQALADQVDEFLQHAFQGSNLILPVGPNKWTVLARCHQHDVEAMLDRVRTALGEANEDRPTGKLPPITFDVKGTWSVESDMDGLLRCLRTQSSPNAPEHRTPRVLVIDDDREMLCGLDIRLTANGFEVLTAANGKSGVDLAITSHPDAILMDNYMPVMDGLEALNRLHANQQTADIPVIMLSASLRDQHEALEQGARFFLQKPCDPVTVVAALNEVMRSDEL